MWSHSTMTTLVPQEITRAPERVGRRIVELPIEVHEDIIGSLDNWTDAGTIANCALVCQTWLPFSRSKLYHIVYLQYRRQWICFENLLANAKFSSMEHYLEKMSELHILVQDVEFFDKARTQPRIGWRQDQEHPWAHTVLDRCSLRLTGLTRIALERADYSPSHELALDCGYYYRSLTTLSLRRCTFSNIVQLHRFVTAFPALSDLTLHSLLLQSTSVPSRIPVAGHPLTHLELECQNDVVAAVSRWLSDTHLVRSLARLEWWPWIEEEAEQAWETLVSVIDGPCLQELVCIVHHSWQVDLFPFTRLRVLRLRESSKNLDEHLTSLKGILGSVSSHQLEELHISQAFTGDQTLASILAMLSALMELDVILARPQFSHLRRVELDYGVQISMQDVCVEPNQLAPVFPIRVTPEQSSWAQEHGDADHALSHRIQSPYMRNVGSPFTSYAGELVKSKLREGLKQLNSRGILVIELYIDADRRVGQDEHTQVAVTVGTTPVNVPLS